MVVTVLAVVTKALGFVSKVVTCMLVDEEGVDVMMVTELKLVEDAVSCRFCKLEKDAFLACAAFHIL